MEEVLIVGIVFGSGLLFLYLIFEFIKSKRNWENVSAGDSNSLTESDLKRLVRSAVEDALDERFGRLEKRLEEFSEPRLIPAGKREDDIDQPSSPPVAGDRESTR